MNDLKKRLWTCLLLAAGTAILYWPITGHGFIGFDDNEYLVQNWHIQSGITGRGIAWAFQSGYASNWHPLTWISHMLDVQFYGLNPARHHLTNLIIHALNSVLLFLLLNQMTRALWRSAFVAALFAWHPLHVESVAWAAERKDVLCAFFWILTLMAYTQYARKKSLFWMQSHDSGPSPNIPKLPPLPGGENSLKPVARIEPLNHNATEASVSLSSPKGGEGGGEEAFRVHGEGRGEGECKHNPVHPRGVGAGLYYGLSLVLFACALMSKPMAVTLPCVLLLMDFWPLQRFVSFRAPHAISADAAAPAPALTRNPRALILEKLPYFLLAIVASIITFKAQQAGGAVGTLATAPLSLRFENAFFAYAAYIFKIIWPAHLAVLYPLSSLSMVSVVGAALLFVVISVTAFGFAKRFPYFFTGWFWFAGTLVPVIGLIQVGGQSMADRYTYIPSIGLFIAIVWGAAALVSQAPQARNVLAGAGIMVLAAFFILARHQIGYWQNGETLFKHAIAVTRNNYLAYSALSSSLGDAGHADEAIQMAAEAVRIQPDYPEGEYNLGTLLLDAGKTDEAIQHLAAALKKNPRFTDAENNLGKAYQNEGKLDDAVAHLAVAHSYSPNDPEILYNLGAALLMQEKLPEAAARFSEAIQIMPEHAEAHGNLGVILMRTGHPEEGTREFAEKVRLKPNDSGARLNYGLALLNQNKPAEAAAQFNEALRIEPDSALGHYRLSLALAGLGKSQDAITHCREALRLQPDFPDARQTLESWTNATK